MGELDIIENRISLLEPSIEFEEIVNAYLSEEYAEEELEEMDKLGFRRNKLLELQHRFTNIYNLDILHAENGYSILNIGGEEDIEIKKYLHRFLSFKCITGGENASVDGSDELFEDISANAVRNYLGEGAKTVMVGEGGANLTEERLEQIARELNELTGLYHNLPNQAKDDGVDFIAYKPIDNRNIGNIIVLGQACVGKTYKRKKTIHDRWQNEYIPFAVRPPITLLSIVYYLEADKLRRIHSEFGNSVVFDKGRIIRFFETSDNVLNNRIIEFVNTKVHD